MQVSLSLGCVIMSKGYRIICLVCKNEVSPHWESRYNGIRATCEKCGTNWAES